MSLFKNETIKRITAKEGTVSISFQVVIGPQALQEIEAIERIVEEIKPQIEKIKQEVLVEIAKRMPGN